MCIRICICIRIVTAIGICILYMCKYVYTCVFVYMHIYIRTYIHTYIHTCSIYTHTCICAYVEGVKLESRISLEVLWALTHCCTLRVDVKLRRALLLLFQPLGVRAGPWKNGVVLAPCYAGLEVGCFCLHGCYCGYSSYRCIKTLIGSEAR